MICAHPQTVAMTFLCLQRRHGISNEKDESKEGLEQCVTLSGHCQSHYISLPLLCPVCDALYSAHQLSSANHLEMPESDRDSYNLLSVTMLLSHCLIIG